MHQPDRTLWTEEKENYLEEIDEGGQRQGSRPPFVAMENEEAHYLSVRHGGEMEEKLRRKDETEVIF